MPFDSLLEAPVLKVKKDGNDEFYTECFLT